MRRLHTTSEQPPLDATRENPHTAQRPSTAKGKYIVFLKTHTSILPTLTCPLPWGSSSPSSQCWKQGALPMGRWKQDAWASEVQPQSVCRARLGWAECLDSWRFLKQKPGQVLPSLQKNSVLFSCSVMSDSLQPHGLEHTRLPCPSPTPGVCSKSCPLSRWCHPTISSSVVPFSCLQFFPESGSFLMSQFFTSDSQSIGVSASASVLPMNIQDWLISL